MGLFGKKKTENTKRTVICDCCEQEFDATYYLSGYNTAEVFFDRDGFDIWRELDEAASEYSIINHNDVIDFGTKKVCQKCFTQIYEGITGESYIYASGDDHDSDLAKLKYKHIADMISDMDIDEIKEKRQLVLDKIAEEEAEKEALRDAETRIKASQTASKMDEWLKNLE